MSTTPDLDFVETPKPAEDDLDDLAAPPRRKSRVSAATIVLALACVGCVGFALGVVVEKKQLPETNGSQVSAAAQPGGAGAARTTTTASGAAGAAVGAGAGGPGGAGGGLVGQVTAVSGNTLTVTDASGNAVKVNIAAQAVITRTSTATAADIKTGDYVTVQGPTGADGATTANRIVDSGSTPPAGGRPGAGGAAGGPNPTSPTGSAPTGSGPLGSRPQRTTTVP